MSYKEDTRYFEDRGKCKIKCSCGHTQAIPSILNKMVCRWCGKYIFKDKREEFKYRLYETRKRKN